MGFGGFLKKLGTDVVKAANSMGGPVGAVATLVEGFLPSKVQNIVSSGVADLDAIAEVVQIVESTAAVSGGMKGEQKLAAALPAVNQIVAAWLSSGALGSQEIGDAATFKKGVSELTSGIADIQSSLKPKTKSA